MKTNPIKQIISILLALVMLVGLLPTAALSASVEEIVYYNTWVGNQQITSENMNNVLGDGTVKYIPPADTTPAMLILTEAQITADNTSSAAIETKEVLTVMCYGSNHLKATTTGIYSEEKLLLKSDGTGSLSVEACSQGIFSRLNSVQISGFKKLSIKSGVNHSLGAEMPAIYAFCGIIIKDCALLTANNTLYSGNGGNDVLDMTIDNSTVKITLPKADTERYGIDTNAALTIRNAQVEINSFDESAKNNYIGIYAQLNVTIGASSTITIADAKRGIRSSRDVEINSSNVSVSASEYVLRSNTNNITLTNCEIDGDKTPVKISEGEVVNTADGEIATAVEIKQTATLAKHKVMVTVNDSSLGNVLALGLNNEGKIIEGAAVTLRATPTPGNRFVGWKSGEDYISSDSECSVIITEETNIVAEFAKGLIFDTWVGGVQVTSDNKDDVLGDGTVKYIPLAGTTPAMLVLTNAQITADNTSYAAIETKEVLTVMCYGSNHVKATTTTGIYSEKEISLKSNGTGSLSVEACSQGIFSRLNSVQISGLKELSIKSGVNHSLGAEMPAIYAFCGITIKDCELLTANNTLYSGNGGYDVLDMTIDNSTVKITLPKADTELYGIRAWAALHIINDSYVLIEAADADAKDAYKGIFSQNEMFITDSHVSVKDSATGIYSRETIEITRSRVYVTASVTNIEASGDENDPNVYYIKLKECALTYPYTKLFTTVDERDGWGDDTTVVSSDGSFATTVAIGMPLTDIEIQGITPPKDGVALDKTGIHKGDTNERASYRISNRTWYDVTDGKTMNNGDTFQLGHTYRYKAIIVMKDDGCDSFPSSAEDISISLAGIANEYTVEKKFNSSGTIFTCDIYFACTHQLPDPPIHLVGDVDENGKVEAADALEVLKSVVGKATLTDQQLKAADTDGNGKADATDALNILKKVVGKIDKFPVEA